MYLLMYLNNELVTQEVMNGVGSWGTYHVTHAHRQVKFNLLKAMKRCSIEGEIYLSLHLNQVKHN